MTEANQDEYNLYLMTKSLDRSDFVKNAEVYKILAHPTRLEILHMLKMEDTSVHKLLKVIKVRKSVLSQHLAILRNTGLVTSTRSGKNIVYSFKYPKLLEACYLLTEIREKKSLL